MPEKCKVVAYYLKAFQELGCLFWERAWSTVGCCDMEDIAMLVFYLPIIIFEAMLQSQANKTKAGARANSE